MTADDRARLADLESEWADVRDGTNAMSRGEWLAEYGRDLRTLRDRANAADQDAAERASLHRMAPLGED